MLLIVGGAVLALYVVMVPLTGQVTGAGDIVLRAAQADVIQGAWSVVADVSAAGGSAIRHPDAGAAKRTAALAAPSDYFELTFDAQGGKPYRLWLRGKAERNAWANDSVFVQFSGSVASSGAAAYRIGTSSALEVNLEDCSGCGLSNWGWQDTGWGVGVLGPAVSFASSGPQTIRIQTREDGLTVDQVLLSPQKYLTSPPGALKNDATIFPPTDGGDVPDITLHRGPYLQQTTDDSVRVVWATRESGAADVRYGTTGPTTVVNATSRLIAATTSGLPFDYYHHEALIDGLSGARRYVYNVAVDDVVLLSSNPTFVTAPAPGTGTVTFVAFGDSGNGSTAQRQIATVMGQDVFDLVLHAGDIVYGSDATTGPATWSKYDDWFFAIYSRWLPTRPFFPAEGNHDSNSANGNGRAYLNLFSLPTNGASSAFPDHAERYYSFDYGPVHFVALDTEFAFQSTTRRIEQQDWLEADLAGTNQPWKIAYFHRSPFSSGGEHGSDLAVRQAFSPIFERYGVQLAISAHEHTYERTKPWRTGSTGTPVTYIVTGGGGGRLYAAGSASYTAKSASVHHYLRGRADQCSLSVAAIGLDSKIFDQATLSRCGTSARDVVLYAADPWVRAGAWSRIADSTAAAGVRLQNPNAGAAKLTTASANPGSYVELTFNVTAGVPYRLWIRGKAASNAWGNDSVFVQFSGSVTSTGSAIYRIGTSSATAVNLEDCAGCGLSGWGWQDNGWGVGVLGPTVRFATTGTQRIRIQPREDGLSFDQIVLSPSTYLSTAPGGLKNDTTIVAR
jgi:hypothetical protein